jgi:hypothetical protein
VQKTLSWLGLGLFVRLVMGRTMDANKQPSYAEVRPVDRDEYVASKKEVAEMNEVISPLRPVALRVEQISERDAEKLFEAAKATPAVVSRLKREPRRMATRERDSGVR